MKISITHELIVFLSMTALGLFEGFVFDVFRVVRKNISKTFWKVSITDVVYWFVSGAIFAAAVWKVTNGELRAYMFLGIGLGLIFHFLLLSDLIISIITKIFTLFLKIFKFFLKILLTPTQFLYKMVLKPIIIFLKRKIGCVSKIRNMRKSGIRNDKKTK